MVQNQRERILHAVAVVSSRKGFAGMAVEDLVTEAGVSRRTFYDHYANREEVFLDAYDQAAGLLMRTVQEAYDGADSFVEAVQDCIEAFLGTLSAGGEVAHMAIVEALAAGQGAIESRNATMRQFAELFDAGAKRFGLEMQGPSLLPQTIVGGMYEVVYTRVLEGETETLTTLLPDFAYTALLPYLGGDAARAEYERLVKRRDRLAKRS